MLLPLAILGLIFWPSLYIRILEIIFAWVSKELRDTRLKRCHIMKKLMPDPLAMGDGHHMTMLSQKVKNRLVNRVEEMSSLVCMGLETILDDDVMPRFVAAPAPRDEWNLLTRNFRKGGFQLNWRLWLVWLVGWFIRYVVLLPLRTLAAWASLFLTCLLTVLLGQLPECLFKRMLAEEVMRLCFRFMACCLPIIRRYHNTENRPFMGIVVCNHTSPLDVLVLMSDAHYTVTGQIHDGILGMVQRALSRISPQMWFDRRQLGDREALGMILRQHGGSSDRPPILIFPEGTCVNNTAVLQFKKGSFAVNDIVYPVAIRYDRRFGEAYWNSSLQTMLRYLVMVVSSWCIYCDVFYMKPLKRGTMESAVEFSNRVKAAIADEANIDNLPWDGNLKRATPERDWR